MRKFIDYSWWKDVTIATTGTIVGIILTFGTTALLEDKTRKEMAGKTVLMTLHNLDSSIDNLSNLLGEMQKNDTLFYRALSLMPDSLGVMGMDSMQMIVNRFASTRIHITDMTTRQIFSSSFEVWQNIDDAKVIGRIGNCYSILDLCYKEYDKVEKLRTDAFRAFWSELPPQDYDDVEEAVKAFLKCNDVRYAMNVQAYTSPMLVSVNGIARQLNDRNKEVLHITQDELDEVGNLLDKNQFFTEEDYKSQK